MFGRATIRLGIGPHSSLFFFSAVLLFFYLVVLLFSKHTETKLTAIFHIKFDLPLITACSELCKVLFLALSVTFLFVCQISLEPLNGFAPNSHGRRVWSLARRSLIRFMFGKTSLL